MLYPEIHRFRIWRPNFHIWHSWNDCPIAWRGIVKNEEGTVVFRSPISTDCQEVEKITMDFIRRS